MDQQTVTVTLGLLQVEVTLAEDGMGGYILTVEGDGRTRLGGIEARGSLVSIDVTSAEIH